MSNILIIDDEKAIRKTLTEILSYEGYKIEEAGDGEEGLKKFREKTFDVVLCDIKMPKMDGIEFLDKAREGNPDIPVIMISGHGTTSKVFSMNFFSPSSPSPASSILYPS